MAITARTVRWVLLAAGLALVAAILGFAGYAHYRARHFFLGLQGKLGVDIKQETNGFTYSQSVAGRTVFTIHAAKEIQRTDGRITLHDVGITLYGRTPDRADRIHGNEFEYDPVSGALKAAGEVYLDLEAPAGSLPANPDARGDSRMVHVKTSGLIFLEKERTASTDQAIEFSAGGWSGRATGAFYDAAAGLVILKHDVSMDGVRNGLPLKLTAARVELDRNVKVVRLTSATAAEDTGSGVQRLSAQQSIVELTAGGTPSSLHAEGHVLLTQDSGGSLSGDRLQADLAEGGAHSSLLRRAHLSGDVHFQKDLPGDQEQAQARDLNIVFNRMGRPERADLLGGVSLVARSGPNVRTLLASRIQLGFRTAADGRSALQGADAFGDTRSAAQLRLTSPQPKRAGELITNVSAKHLLAQFAAVGKSAELQTLDGEGQAAIDQIARDGGGAESSEEASTGDTLHAVFARGATGQLLLTHAEQHGHVTGLRQVSARAVKGRAIPAEEEHFRGENAAFDALTNRVLLTGAAEIADASSELFSDTIALDRGSGMATADGLVRLSYEEAAGKGEPLHITAARAQSDKTSGLTKFFGATRDTVAGASGKNARLWQGGSQVEAAEIDFNRSDRKVVAKGNGGLVHAILTSGGGGGKSGLVRVTSRELTYTDSTRQVELNGSVKLTEAYSSLQSAKAVLSLAKSASAGDKGASASPLAGHAAGLMSGKVERIVANGGVTLNQPGRRAIGDKLVYTAADQTYVLTGTPSVPPRLIDESRGTITGTSLLFHGSDDSVEILGGDGQRVQTQTRLRTKTKGK